jgi:hypothetical protein
MGLRPFVGEQKECTKFIYYGSNKNFPLVPKSLSVSYALFTKSSITCSEGSKNVETES